MTKDTVISKLRKLMAKAKSAEAIGNTAEAAAFVAKVEELLARNELEMSDVEMSEMREEDPIEETAFSPDKHGLPRNQRRVEWQERLAEVLAHGFFCRILVSKGSNRVWFVGRRSHVEVVTYVYARLVREVLRLQDSEEHDLYVRVRDAENSAAALVACRGFKASFRNRFISAIYERLREADTARRDSLQAEGNGTALMRLADAHAAVRLWVDEKHGHKKPAAGMATKSGGNAEGVARGRKAGRAASLAGDGLGAGEKSGGPKQLGAGR